MNIEQLQQHFNSQDYDKKYQDIEVLRFVGYSKSHISWNNLQEIVDWKNKIICDLGCFHGYFSIKAIQSGAKNVIGLDRSSTVLETSKLIIEASGLSNEIDFKVWQGGDGIPECDLILCLNVLHHFDDISKALSKMHTDTIFEVNITEEDKIKECFDIVKVIQSHRDNRKIYLCKRK